MEVKVLAGAKEGLLVRRYCSSRSPFIEFSELVCPLNKFLVAWFHVLASKFVT